MAVCCLWWRRLEPILRLEDAEGGCGVVDARRMD